MRIDTLRATCDEGHVADIEIVVDCPLQVAAASLKAARCPECGSANLGIGGQYRDAPDISAPLAERVAWWQHRGEHGTSSLTLFAAFTGEAESPHGRFDWPYDPADFRRCKQLLDLFPEWRDDLAKVAERFPWMQPFVDRWAEFERLWQEEIVDTGASVAPRLYQALRAAREEAKALLDKESSVDD